jgi:hypothetical protein
MRYPASTGTLHLTYQPYVSSPSIMYGRVALRFHTGRQWGIGPGRRPAGFRQAVRLLRTHPGLSDLGGQVVISEIGVDMSRFPTAGHLVSWVGLCPRNDESAGKRRSNRLRKGAPWLKPCLSNVPRRRCERGVPITRRNSSGCDTGEGPRRQSVPWQPQCSPQSTICYVTASSTKTLERITFTALQRSRRIVSPSKSPSWDSPAPSHQRKRFVFRCQSPPLPITDARTMAPCRSATAE